KPLFLVLPLACAALLLSGCPDSKLPTPTPTVPTPKAQDKAGLGLPGAFAWQRQAAAMPASEKRS
ncbi:MAG: hypothetical protein JWP77_592, partial [Polaromonas sp.]|nr:hypothetical protein [Polaromonas sp.]